TYQTNTLQPPTVNSSGIGLHYAFMTPGTNDLQVWQVGEGTVAGTNAIWWKVGTATVTACNTNTNCTGHVMGGINGFVTGACVDSVVNVAACNLQSGYDLYATPQTGNQSVYAPPQWDAPLPFIGAQHISWANDRNDSQPWFTGLGGFGIGPATFHLQNEFFSSQAAAPNPVYRFFNARADGQWAMGWPNNPSQGNPFYYWPFCSVSQDGLYALCSTDWDSAVGYETGAWAPSTAYTQGNFETDSSGNLEAETAASCTSGASAPAWGTTLGSKITGDGNCAWTLVELYGYPNTGLIWNAGAVGWTGNYVAGSVIIDSHGNLEKEMTPYCMAGATQPTWPTAPGSVTDGGCTWSFVGSTGLSGPPSSGVWTRQDVFVFELR
ncbi:MAG: hypothetical protein ACRD2G_06865, partial [Terriglobia bacterium]